MAAAVAQNNAPSPHSHSSNGSSSPESQRTRLAPPSAPIYTQEDVIRFVQAALVAAGRDQSVNAHSSSRNAQIIQEERVMKPRVHLYERFGPQRLMFAALELPGLQKTDVRITARSNGDLIISGERRPQHLLFLHNLQRKENDDEQSNEDDSEEKGRTVFNELKFGKFQRVIRLPSGTDPTSINASMDDGMLTICWPLPATIASGHSVKRENASDSMHTDELDAKRTSLRSS